MPAHPRTQQTGAAPDSPACAGVPAAPDASPPHPPVTGLLLTGGGARAAYQVGVLQAISALRRACGAQRGPNPFPVISGTSAGAINAAALACGADNFPHAVQRIAQVWGRLHANQVYGADALSVLRSGARWLTLLSLGWALARWRRMRPRSLLDNAPLETLLRTLVPLERLPRLIDSGHLRALAVTASSYSTGEHVTFFASAAPMAPWVRSQRRATRTRITHAHLLASAAIPFVFPARAIGDAAAHTEYFGDGSMRQSAPIAPTIHLGAERILVIGAGRMHEPHGAPANPAPGYPTLAQIAGHALSSIFLDALAVDVERAQRINQTLALIPANQRQHSTLRTIELLLIAPSQRLDTLAARHVAALPRPVRSMLGALGLRADGADVRGAALASYLLFESGYTQELMALGRADTLAQRAAVCRFFGWTDSGAALRLPARG